MTPGAIVVGHQIANILCNVYNAIVKATMIQSRSLVLVQLPFCSVFLSPTLVQQQATQSDTFTACFSPYGGGNADAIARIMSSSQHRNTTSVTALGDFTNFPD
jgi:hypothetical protein